MITEKIKNLFKFIEFLHSNIENFKQYDEIINELQTLEIESCNLQPRNSFKDKLKHDEVKAEIKEKFNIIYENIVKAIYTKAKELNIVDQTDPLIESLTIYNWNSSAIDELKKTFNLDDIPEILQFKSKYNEYKTKIKTDYYQSLFFGGLDKVLKELFDFFQEQEPSEAEQYEQSIRSGYFATKEEAEIFGCKVGEPSTKIPPPKSIDELFKRLHKIHGQRVYKSNQRKFSSKYGDGNLKTITDEINELNHFIGDAESLSTADTFKNPIDIISSKRISDTISKRVIERTKNDLQNQSYLQALIEYSRLKHGYYETKEFIPSYETFFSEIAPQIYGTYFLYKQWLDEKLKSLKAQTPPPGGQPQQDKFKNESITINRNDFSTWLTLKTDWKTVNWEYNTENKYQHKQGLTALFWNGYIYVQQKFEAYFKEFNIIPDDVFKELIFDFRQHFPKNGRVEGVNYYDDLIEQLIEKHSSTTPPPPDKPQQGSKTEPEQQQNPYPRIFTSYKAFQLCQHLMKNNVTKNQLADVSCYFHFMIKDEFIFKNIKRKEFYEYLQKEHDIPIEKLKPEGYNITDAKKQIYTTVKSQFQLH